MPKATHDASTSPETAPIRRRASKRKPPLPANVFDFRAYRRQATSVAALSEQQPVQTGQSDFEVIIGIRSAVSDETFEAWLNIGRQIAASMQGGAA